MGAEHAFAERLGALRARSITLDSHAVLMALLFLAVQLGAVALAVYLDGLGANPKPPGGVEGASAGAAWVSVEVAFAVVLLAVAIAYKRAPEWLQTVLKWNAIVAGLLWLGSIYGTSGIPFILVAVTLWIVTDEFDVYWIINDLLGIFFAIYLGAGIALIFGVEALLVALVGFTIYDHYFANKRTWMFSMAELLLKIRLPVIVFVPEGWRLDWDEMIERLAEDEEDGAEDELLSWGIGMADLMFPAGVAAALAIAPTGGLFGGGDLIVLGVIVGTVIACFRLRYEMINKGSGAGLPALAAGVFGGWLIALSLTTIGLSLGIA